MSTTSDPTTDESTDIEDTPSPEEIANQATTDVENSVIGRAIVLHAYADDEGFYVEIQNNLAVKSTCKLTTLITGYAAALFDEFEEPCPVTIVGHMSNDKSTTAKVDLGEGDFEALDESDVAFRQRVIENIERVL